MSLLIVTFNIVACLLVCDFLSGLGHWLEDSYGTLKAPALLKRWIVLDNIQHHRLPGTILRGSWWECNRVLTVAGGLIAVLCLLFRVTDWRVYFILALGSQSNQIHRWGHQRNAPLVVRGLQRLGVFQSRAHHAQHHRSPYAVRFCTSTNWLNPILDSFHFWRGLEAVIEFVFGVPVKRVSAERGGY